MKRGTTPTHIFTLPFDARSASIVKIIYAQNSKKVFIKTGDDIVLNGNTITTKLTQEDTFSLDCNMLVEIQVRVLLNDNTALASDIIRVTVEKCLENEVLA